MTPERWERILEIFERCQTLPSADRALVLSEIAEETDVVTEVERLLRKDSEAQGFLDETPDAVKELRSPPKARLMPGEHLASRYTIRRQLGKGGMGEVYAAYDEQAYEEIAIKISHSAVAADYRLELLLGRQVTHPAVCRLYDLGQHKVGSESLDFLTMELVEGETLAERLRRTGPLPIDEATRIAEQLIRGLSAIHRAGIVHRDLTPFNIILSGNRVVIVDFGRAARESEKPGPLMGTLDYLAPEQLRGELVSASADLFTLGVVLHEMATGKPYDRHRRQEFSLPHNWRLAISVACEIDVSQRADSAAQVLQILTCQGRKTRRKSDSRFYAPSRGHRQANRLTQFRLQ